METIIFKNCRLIDPSRDIDEPSSEIWIQDGVVVTPESTQPQNSQIFDLHGKWLMPGFIDMHVHLREPGEEYKESIQSGTRAAAASGFTAIACMPNTKPVNDCASITQFILESARGCDCRVYPVGTISAGCKGEGLAEIGEMKEAGAVAITDDGLPVKNSQLLRRALEYASSHEISVISHSEEESLSRNGCMNEGVLSTQMGLRGIPNAAESTMVYRDIALAELTGVPIHLAHISTRESLDLIRQAKARGTQVTAETAPHYFSLTEKAVEGYNTNAKMNPPLRSDADVDAIKEALADGTLDAIATDHAPHSILEKELEYSLAANGIIGLETSIPLTLELVKEGCITPSKMVELISTHPAAILKVPGGRLAPGDQADITVVDPEKEFTYTQKSIISKSSNSPFLGRKFTGKAVMTIVGGRITHSELE